jgi:hypothetical protein
MSDDANKPRPIYVLRLQPEKGCTDPPKALRRLLKIALRRCNLRCLSAEEVQQS